MIKYTIQEIIAWAPTFSLLEIVTQKDACAASSGTWDLGLHLDTDPKGRFVSFKFTPSNERVFCVYAPSGQRTAGQGAFL